MQTYASRRRAEQRTPAPRPEQTKGPSLAQLAAGAAPTREQMGRQVDLPGAIREKMEASFGADFSNVKVYESQTVADAGARAMTMGSHVMFAPGQLDFASTGGQSLLGHELSHVVSQARGESRGVGFLRDAGLEAQADRQGAMAAAGETVYSGPVTPISATSTALSASGPMQAKKKDEDAEMEAYHVEQERKSAEHAAENASRDMDFDTMIKEGGSDYAIKRYNDNLAKKNEKHRKKRSEEKYTAARQDYYGNKYFSDPDEPPNRKDYISKSKKYLDKQYDASRMDPVMHDYLSRHLEGKSREEQDAMIAAFQSGDMEKMRPYFQEEIDRVSEMDPSALLADSEKDVMEAYGKMGSVSRDLKSMNKLVKSGVITPESMGYDKNDGASREKFGRFQQNMGDIRSYSRDAAQLSNQLRNHDTIGGESREELRQKRAANREKRAAYEEKRAATTFGQQTSDENFSYRNVTAEPKKPGSNLSSLSEDEQLATLKQWIKDPGGASPGEVADWKKKFAEIRARQMDNQYSKGQSSW